MKNCIIIKLPIIILLKQKKNLAQSEEIYHIQITDGNLGHFIIWKKVAANSSLFLKFKFRKITTS